MTSKEWSLEVWKLFHAQLNIGPVATIEGIIADLAATEACRDGVGRQLRLATMAEANAEADANDLRGELAEANRQIDALAAEKRQLEASIPARERSAFVAGCKWTTWGTNTDIEDARVEAVRRYKEASHE